MLNLNLIAIKITLLVIFLFILKYRVGRTEITKSSDGQRSGDSQFIDLLVIGILIWAIGGVGNLADFLYKHYFQDLNIRFYYMIVNSLFAGIAYMMIKIKEKNGIQNNFWLYLWIGVLILSGWSIFGNIIGFIFKF